LSFLYAKRLIKIIVAKNSSNYIEAAMGIIDVQNRNTVKRFYIRGGQGRICSKGKLIQVPYPKLN